VNQSGEGSGFDGDPVFGSNTHRWAVEPSGRIQSSPVRLAWEVAMAARVLFPEAWRGVGHSPVRGRAGCRGDLSGPEEQLEVEEVVDDDLKLRGVGDGASQAGI